MAETAKKKAAEKPEPTGLETTGNVNDLATKPDALSAEVADQEGADPALSEAVKLSEELGYVAPEQTALKPKKPDYSQANPEVMNGGGKS